MAVKVKYLPKQHIEWNADKLLADFGERFGTVTEPPVPVEEILETHLRLTLEIDNLESRLGFSDILGALWAPKALVAIDQSLDPAEHPRMEGRFRYTLGHEIGHWIQHRHYFLPDRDHAVRFAGGPQLPSVICRTSQAKEPIEWQADYFSACLLMPRAMVSAVWEHERSRVVMICPLNHLKRETMVAMGLGELIQIVDSTTLHAAAAVLAPIFKVSNQAMKIRLEELKLIQDLGTEFSVQKSRQLVAGILQRGPWKHQWL